MEEKSEKDSVWDHLTMLSGESAQREKESCQLGATAAGTSRYQHKGNRFRTGRRPPSLWFWSHFRWGQVALSDSGAVISGLTDSAHRYEGWRLLPSLQQDSVTERQYPLPGHLRHKTRRPWTFGHHLCVTSSALPLENVGYQETGVTFPVSKIL